MKPVSIADNTAPPALGLEQVANMLEYVGIHYTLTIMHHGVHNQWISMEYQIQSTHGMIYIYIYSIYIYMTAWWFQSTPLNKIRVRHLG